MAVSRGLYRSRKDAIIGGVASGIAEALNIDPLIIRIIFVVFTLAGGSGTLLYIILWIALPLDPDPAYYEHNLNEEDMNIENENADQKRYDDPVPPPRKSKNDGSLIGGLILITLGIIFLVERFFPWIDFSDLWPLLLIVAGTALLIMNYSGQKKK